MHKSITVSNNLISCGLILVPEYIIRQIPRIHSQSVSMSPAERHRDIPEHDPRQQFHANLKHGFHSQNKIIKEGQNHVWHGNKISD